MAEYLEFSTTNELGYIYGTRIKYTISGSTLYIEDVQFKSVSAAHDNPFYLDGKIKINGVTVYTCDNEPIVLNSMGDWISSGISCSSSVSGSSVSVQFAPNNWSTFFGIYGTNEKLNFKVSSTAKTIEESGNDNGDEEGGGDLWEPGDDSGLTPRYLHVNQGEGTVVKVRRSYPGHRKCWDSIEPTDPIYCDGQDTFYIEVAALPGYELDYYNVEGRQVPYLLENFIYSHTEPTIPDRHYYRLHYDMDASVTATAHMGSGNHTGYIYIRQGEGTKLTVTRTHVDNDLYFEKGNYIGELVDGTPILDENGEQWYRYNGWYGDLFSIEAEALPGYTIDKYYNEGIFLCNYQISGQLYGELFDDGSQGWWFETFPEDSVEENIAWIRSSATLNRSAINIDTDGSGFNPYTCYIDTEIISYPQVITECEIIGQKEIIGEMWSGTVTYPSNDYRTNAYSSWGSKGDYYNNVYCLKFKTQSNLGAGTHTSITFHIKTGGKKDSTEDTNTLMNYALCTSDANCEDYALSFGTHTDEYCITTGTFNEVLDGVNLIVIDNVELSPDTNYYLFVWDVNSGGVLTEIYPAENHSVVVTREDTNSVIHSIEFKPYNIYIDNGESWEPL